MVPSKNKKYDIVIIGAGPAGLAAARTLAENKKSVLVLEKNKVIGPKVCAGGLTTKDFELGIDKKLAEHFFSKVILHTPLFNDDVKNNKPFVATIDRGKLGQYMTKQAQKAGADIKSGVEVEEIKEKFVIGNGIKYFFDNLIGADGSNSQVRDFLGIKKEAELVAFHYKVSNKFPDLELFYDAELFGGGYAWIFPHKNFTSIGCCADIRFLINSEQLQENFGKWVKKNYPKIKLDKEDYEAWIINYDYRGHEFGNKFLAGDAAGFGSGLTGEGMYFAMISGLEIAKKIIDPKYLQPKMKEILELKQKHEKILNMITKNVTLSQIEYDLLGLAQKSRLLDEKLIDSFS